jgi:aspartyl-tRNA(Asn)/glutamyl-tRNA(Gln) amidotransferase subunit A
MKNSAPAQLLSLSNEQCILLQSIIHISMSNVTPPVDSVSISFSEALDLAAMIRSKQITSEQLTKIYLARLDKYGAQLGAIVTLTPEIALAQAKKADDDLHHGHIHSALHGVPYGIKDLFAAKGAPTTWGSPIYKDRVIDADAAVVQKLQDAGCPLLGKLAMIEFAGSVGYRYANASLTGACRTPWDLDCWSGGSSAGSGAAVSAGLVGFAIGTETWGSILCPSAFCGVSGLRPTSGRVSREGAMALSWTMDKVGPIARSVADTAAVLEIISGDTGDDISLRGDDAKYTVPARYPKLSNLRVGVVHPDYGTGDNAQPETEQVFKDALTVLRTLGVLMTDIVLPDLPTDSAATAILVGEGGSAFQEVIRDGTLLPMVIDPESRGGLIASLAMPAGDYIRALRVRELAQKAIAQTFAQVDVLVSPSFLQTAPLVTADLDTYFVGSDKKISGLSNMLGLPAVAVPMGFGAGKLPLGLQFVAAPLREDDALSVAYSYQTSTDWYKRRPPLFDR